MYTLFRNVKGFKKRRMIGEFVLVVSLLGDYTDNHLSLNPFDFKINAPQSCGFVGVDTTQFTK